MSIIPASQENYRHDINKQNLYTGTKRVTALQREAQDIIASN